MGGFLLARRKTDSSIDETEKSLKNSLDVFVKKGLNLHKSIVMPDFVVYAFHKLAFPTENVVIFPDKQFIIATGTLIYKGKIGSEPLKQLFNDFTENGEFLKETFGQYCLVVYKKGKLYILNDPSGIYPIYIEKNENVFSSSFLALSKMQQSPQISPQEFYEYVTSECFYGSNTLLKGIDILDNKSIVQLSPTIKYIPKPMNTKPLDTSSSFQEMIEQVGNNLIEYFSILKSAFGDSIGSALSGGFDTRLMVAALRRVGVKPYLFVNGQDNSPDVTYAEAIARGEGLDLEREYRREFTQHDTDTYDDILEKNLFWLDGIGEEYGVFVTDFDLKPRFKRSEAAVLHLNGSGGEMYRNRLMLPNRSFDLVEVIKSKFDNFPSSIFLNTFDRKEYLESIMNKSKVLYGNKVANIDRQEIEKVYALFSLRYWLGNIAKLNNQFSYSIYPFTEISISTQSIDIPIKYKTYGCFNAALINFLDPAIAKYDSQYGYRYSEYENIPTFVKLYNQLKIHSPLKLRALMRRHIWRKLGMNKGNLPYYLISPYIDRAFPEGTPNISQYVNIQNITNPNMLSRVFSVELMTQNRL